MDRVLLWRVLGIPLENEGVFWPGFWAAKLWRWIEVGARLDPDGSLDTSLPYGVLSFGSWEIPAVCSAVSHVDVLLVDKGRHVLRRISSLTDFQSQNV